MGCENGDSDSACRSCLDSPEIMKKRVLVTGATGFIGRHCLPALKAKEFEIHATFRENQPSFDEEIHWHQADLLNDSQTKLLLETLCPTHLLHFAWYAEPKLYWTSPENLRWLEASVNLLRYFAGNGGKRVVMAGTCAEYDWSDGICAEYTTMLAPKNLYGSCKNMLHTTLTNFAKQSNLSEAWGRIFFVFGEDEPSEKLISATINRLQNGEKVLLLSETQIRDFLHVADVGEAFVALLESEVSGAVNIASGKEIEVRDIIKNIAKILQKEDLLEFGEPQNAVDYPPQLVAETRILNHEVGWQPAKSFDERLKQLISIKQEEFKERVQ
jgi:nucleoside-diphosphate-sugar epimerase